MKTLCDMLEKKRVVNKVYGLSYDDIISQIYNSNEFLFYLNSELIDVENRFRIFNYKDKIYISKKTSLFKGKIEYEKAKQAYKLLNNIKIDDYKISVIVPKIINKSENSYLISNYKGTTIQEYLYNKSNNPLKLDLLIEILKIFIKLGIMHKGLSPRNIIINNKTIYILDWEDAIFYDNVDECFMNLLWKTNVVLDWNYFFSEKEIFQKLGILKSNLESNIQLIKYEEKFKNIIDWSNDNLSLRKKIMEIVLYAERKPEIEINEFYLIPNDLAGIISNLFNFEIDALTDMIFYVLRKKNENLYISFLILLSRLIVYLYKKHINMQPYIIEVFLIMLESAVSTNMTQRNIEISNEYEKLDKIFNYHDYKLLNSFITDENEFKINLTENINLLLKQINSQYKKTNLNINELVQYLINLKK